MPMMFNGAVNFTMVEYSSLISVLINAKLSLEKVEDLCR